MRTLLFDSPEVEYLDGHPFPKVSPKRTHARVQALIGRMLLDCAADRGEVGTEWRFDLGAVDDTNSEFVPDVAFVSNERLNGLSEDLLEERRLHRTSPSRFARLLIRKACSHEKSNATRRRAPFLFSTSTRRDGASSRTPRADRAPMNPEKRSKHRSFRGYDSPSSPSFQSRASRAPLAVRPVVCAEGVVGEQEDGLYSFGDAQAVATRCGLIVLNVEDVPVGVGFGRPRSVCNGGGHANTAGLRCVAYLNVDESGCRPRTDPVGPLPRGGVARRRGAWRRHWVQPSVSIRQFQRADYQNRMDARDRLSRPARTTRPFRQRRAGADGHAYECRKGERAPTIAGHRSGLPGR